MLHVEDKVYTEPEGNTGQVFLLIGIGWLSVVGDATCIISGTASLRAVLWLGT